MIRLSLDDVFRRNETGERFTAMGSINVCRRRWSWRFAASREKVWRILADTARLNEAAGLGRQTIEDLPGPDGTVEHRGSTRLGPWSLEWKRRPTEWVAERGFVQQTDFIGGPLKRMTFRLQLSEEQASTVCDYEIEIEARTLFGAPLSPLIASRLERAYATLRAPLEKYILDDGTESFRVTGSTVESTSDRVESALHDMTEQGIRAEIVERLGELVTSAPEADVRRIRPLELARRSNLGERNMVEACLVGVSAGLLGMQWDLLCPRCSGAKVTATHLKDLLRDGHCSICNIVYDRNFAENVELTFHPAEAIRPIDDGEFCLFGPRSTPHVKIQQSLRPGETRSIDVDLADGDYRVRPLYGGAELDIERRDSRMPSVTFTEEGPRNGADGDPGVLTISNSTGCAIVAVVESRDWVRDALTAQRATTLQLFRDLFGSEVLRHDDEASVERVTLMFTDLRGSTALYSQIGEATAYRFVRAHFAYLAERVRRNNGAIVKTIGDAVMAAFADPADALRAAIEIQAESSEASENMDELRDRRIAIKLGMHQGPAFVVTLNDRLDYFGTTANKAARLSGLSDGGDIVLSLELGSDAAVQELLAGRKCNTCAEHVKGFDAPIRFIRTWPALASPDGTTTAESEAVVQ